MNEIKQDWWRPAGYKANFLEQFPESFVLPHYDGRSIANLPATIGSLLGAPEGWASPALDAKVLEPLPHDIERVVLLLVDGLPWWRLQQQLEQQNEGFNELFAGYGRIFTPITSVAPSTTCVATTVILGNGANAAETGMMGYQFLLPQQGVMANMLFWHPAGRTKERYGELVDWGLQPEGFIPTPTLAEQLSQGGATMRVIMPSLYKSSPLSRMQMRGAQIDGYLNAADMWLKLGGWLGETSGRRSYAYAYYPDFDSLSHRDSPDAPFWSYLWQEFMWHLRQFVAGLTPQQRQKTLLLITADHGHLTTALSERIYLHHHKPLLDMCAMIPGGEPRHLYLYARHGAKDDLLAYARTALGQQFVALDAQDALVAGLFGDPSRLHPETERRMGDVILISKGASYLWERGKQQILLGKHGGLEAEEMLVPLIALGLEP